MADALTGLPPAPDDASDLKFRRLHDSIRDAVVVVDMAGRILEANAAFRDMVGYDDAELRRLTYVDLTPARWHAIEARIVADEVVPHDASGTYEKEYRHKGGRVFPIELRTYLLRDQDGQPQYMWAIVRDISERRRTEEAQRLVGESFRQLVEQSPFGVYAVDADFRLVMVSAGAQRVFENVRPLIGRDFAEVLHLLWPEPFASDSIARFRHTLATGEPYHAPSTVERRADIGETEAYDWKLDRMLLPDGRPGVVCHFYDLSERQRYEAALRDADRQKDQFLAILSHELRNPLAPIRTALALLKTRPLADPAVMRSRDVIDRHTAHMARLLDDLLDISRLSRGTLVLRRSRVSLRDVLGDAIETAAPLIEERGQTLVVRGRETPLALEGDPDRLIQVFGNLLTNAAKYSPAAATITLDARADGDALVVDVRDTGDGIDAGHLPTIFELFSRVESGRHMSTGGLGIGLALVKHLVELHGGTITVTSAGLGHGSTFSVRLPARVDAADVPTAASALLGPAIRRRVLVADDNVDAADTIALLLSTMGCDVHTVYGGEDAVRAADIFRPEIALIDLGMPDLDGWEVCRRIRAQTWGAGIRIVALTGWGRDDDRLHTEIAGFDEHVVKPADPDAVIRLVRDAPARQMH